jgi:hypothetical protein
MEIKIKDEEIAKMLENPENHFTKNELESIRILQMEGKTEDQQNITIKFIKHLDDQGIKHLDFFGYVSKTYKISMGFSSDEISKIRDFFMQLDVSLKLKKYNRLFLDSNQGRSVKFTANNGIAEFLFIDDSQDNSLYFQLNDDGLHELIDFLTND